MEFDWVTALLEALNFLVLVWLLKRFFYRPVLAVIEKRQADSEKIITDAEAQRREADALRSEYELRLAGADKDRDLAMARLDEEIAKERVRRLDVVAAEVAADHQRRDLLMARETSEREAALERRAVAIASRFAARFLDRLAGPELEAKLVDLAMSELGADAQAKLASLRMALRDADVSIKVVTAYPLDAVRRTAIATVLGKLAEHEVAPQFHEDPALKAGVCLMAGSWMLMANLRDELKFFAGTFEHGG